MWFFFCQETVNFNRKPPLIDSQLACLNDPSWQFFKKNIALLNLIQVVNLWLESHKEKEPLISSSSFCSRIYMYNICSMGSLLEFEYIYQHFQGFKSALSTMDFIHFCS